MPFYIIRTDIWQPSGVSSKDGFKYLIASRSRRPAAPTSVIAWTETDGF
jgi:hypothetical protein